MSRRGLCCRKPRKGERKGDWWWDTAYHDWDYRERPRRLYIEKFLKGTLSPADEALWRSGEELELWYGEGDPEEPIGQDRILCKLWWASAELEEEPCWTGWLNTHVLVNLLEARFVLRTSREHKDDPLMVGQRDRWQRCDGSRGDWSVGARSEPRWPYGADWR